MERLPRGQRFSTSLSVHPVAAEAAGEVLGQALETIGMAPDFAMLFVGGTHLEFFHELSATVERVLRPRSFLATGAQQVFAERVELEGATLSLWCANVGPVMTFSVDQKGDELVSSGNALGGAASSCVLLVDPGRLEPAAVLDWVERCQRHTPIVGGAIAGSYRRPTQFWRDGRPESAAAIGFLLPPTCLASTLVVQGSRPIDAPVEVTGSSGRFVTELGGRPALDHVNALVARLNPDEREMARSGLLARITESGAPPGNGALWSVKGADRTMRALAISHEVPKGNTVQFFLRDPDAARSMLSGALADVEVDASGSALVFADRDRNAAFFGEPDVDAQILRDWLSMPIAGLTCESEFGPIQGAPTLHCLSLSVLLLS